MGIDTTRGAEWPIGHIRHYAKLLDKCYADEKAAGGKINWRRRNNIMFRFMYHESKSTCIHKETKHVRKTVYPKGLV